MHETGSSTMKLPIATLVASFPALVIAFSASAAGTDQPLPYDAIQVTATRAALPLMDTPASVSIISGEELRQRAATDLRTALAGLAGIEISAGGDAGPAGSVPALWGLREFDAFLLVVDGVPWGGAFNPALVALDLHDIDRIEVMRGAAPVMYGATSFVGVIHVIHLPAGESTELVTLSGGGVSGNIGDISASISKSLSRLGGWMQSISADVERRRYADEKSGLERGHFLYRAGREAAGAMTTVDVDLNLLRQRPTSPYPRVADGLDPMIDTDANFHPADRRIDQDRLHLAVGHRRPTGLGDWSTTVALSRSAVDVVRGFLAEACGGGAIGAATNACGHSQDREVTDLYFDTHLITPLGESVTAVWGFDNLFGKGKQNSQIFNYAVDPMHGNDALRSSAYPVLEESAVEVERNFYGAYGQLDWKPAPSVSAVLGLRANGTHETRRAETGSPGSPDPPRQSRSHGELSASAGLAWRVWSASDNAITVFADYRDTFKPAAVDFGPGAEADILDPETANSTELGVKTQWLGGRLAMDVAAFDMTMNNLVVAQVVNGSPGLANAGTLHLRGSEAELSWHPLEDTTIYLAYANHRLRFGDYERLFDTVPIQLRGNTPELSPDDIGSIGVQYAPPSGPQLSAFYAYTGERFLNQRNTSLASAFGVLDVSLGYRFHDWELRLVGTNLTDARDPTSESELGDGQYYRMPARTISVFVSAQF